MFRVCLQPYLHSIPSTCTILHHIWPVWLHILSQNNTIFRNMYKNIKCVLIISTERSVPCKRTDRIKLTAAFRNFSEVLNSYNTHVPEVRASKGKDQPITFHQLQRSISPFIFNRGTRHRWTSQYHTQPQHAQERPHPTPYPLQRG